MTDGYTTNSTGDTTASLDDSGTYDNSGRTGKAIASQSNTATNDRARDGPFRQLLAAVQVDGRRPNDPHDHHHMELGCPPAHAVLDSSHNVLYEIRTRQLR